MKLRDDRRSKRDVMEKNQVLFLRISFIIGTIADFVVGTNWLLISLGYSIPNLISSFKGAGTDYRFAMYIGTMFMFGWTVLLFWGYLKPLERRGLLIITAGLLSISIMIELLFYRNLLSGIGFISGIILRLLLIGKFTFSYLYSLKKCD
jgi:hypothetical protein